MSDLHALSVREAAARIRARDVSPVDLAHACLARIRRFDSALNAFITVTEESALDAARAAEAEIAAGRWRGPLHGIPVALKDMIDTAGVRTTAACGAFRDRIPREDAVVVRRLREAGAVLLGKLNMHECAFGGTSAVSCFGPVRNPWALDRVAGGSSGGAAAAVAAGLCYAAVGSDTGGSIREPAALCGVVGLKPSYGRVSTRGIVALAPSLDHLGPLTRCVADAALVLSAIEEPQPALEGRDAAMAPLLARPRRPLDALRIGVPRGFFFDAIEADVAEAFERALAGFAAEGAEIAEVALEVSTDRSVIRRESYDYHAAHMAAAAADYDPQTLAKLRMGADVPPSVYAAARRALDRLRRAAADAVAGVDILVTPTVPVGAPRFADLPVGMAAVLELDGMLLRNTRPFNLNGMPALSLPCGTTPAGLPVGIQVSGRPGGDERLLAVAGALERSMDYRPGPVSIGRG